MIGCIGESQQRRPIVWGS